MADEVIVILTNKEGEDPFSFDQILQVPLHIKKDWLVTLAAISFSEQIEVTSRKKRGLVCVVLPDIVEPVLYGDRCEPVLRIVNYETDNNIAFHNSELLYCKAVKGVYNSVRVHITQLDKSVLTSTKTGFISVVLRFKESAY